MMNLSFCLFFFRLASPSHSYHYETFLFFDLKQKELALPGPLLGFSAGISGKETACQWKRLQRRGLDPWVGKIPEGGHGNPLQYAFLENPHGQRSLMGYDP